VSDEKCDRCGRYIWPQNRGACNRPGCRMVVCKEVEEIILRTLMDRLVRETSATIYEPDSTFEGTNSE
jgi:hypothetical protein